MCCVCLCVKHTVGSLFAEILWGPTVLTFNCLQSYEDFNTDSLSLCSARRRCGWRSAVLCHCYAHTVKHYKHNILRKQKDLFSRKYVYFLFCKKNNLIMDVFSTKIILVLNKRFLELFFFLDWQILKRFLNTFWIIFRVLFCSIEFRWINAVLPMNQL